jgi:hypothetical protein
MYFHEYVRDFWRYKMADTEKYNLVDSLMQPSESKDAELDKVYQARWVWYHTILAAELFLTNILLIGVLIKL